MSETSHHSGEGQREIEEAKLNIERERLALERVRAKREGGILHKHLSAILTAVVSVAAVYMTTHQARETQELQLEVQRDTTRWQTEEETRKALLERDRQIRTEVAEFVAENQEALFSRDMEQRRRVRDILLATFPPEATRELFLRLSVAASASRAEQALWAEAQQLAAKMDGLRVEVYFPDSGRPEAVNRVVNLLRAEGYVVDEPIKRNGLPGVEYSARVSRRQVNVLTADLRELVEREFGTLINLNVELRPGFDFQERIGPPTIKVQLPPFFRREGGGG